MTPRSRILTALSALLLISVFFVPIWTIRLIAPQYSEGIGMHIHVNDITGHSRHDIQNINILNHYIGMKPIVPEEIPELVIMPWLFLGLIVLGFAAAASGRRWVLWIYVGAFTLLLVGGIVDFYLWGLDYGTNLDPMAPIKVPGATYQPPLIGQKTLLNITATSWPHIGAITAGVSLLLGAWALRPGQPTHNQVYA
jgi:copper chaperone NosL